MRMALFKRQMRYKRRLSEDMKDSHPKQVSIITRVDSKSPNRNQNLLMSGDHSKLQVETSNHLV